MFSKSDYLKQASDKFKWRGTVFIYDKNPLENSNVHLEYLRFEFDYFLLNLSAFGNTLTLQSYIYSNNGFPTKMFYIDMPINDILSKTSIYNNFKELIINNCQPDQVKRFQKNLESLEQDCNSQHLQEMKRHNNQKEHAEVVSKHISKP